MLKKLAPYTRGYRWYILLGVLCSVGESVLELELPRAMSEIVDVGIANGDRGYILLTGLKMFLMAMAALLCGVGAAALAAKAAMGFGANLRQAEYEQVQRFSFANIERFSTASLITRLTNDVSSVQMTMFMGMRMCVRAPVMLVTALIKTMQISLDLSRVFLVAVPLLILAVVIVIRYVGPFFTALQNATDDLNLVVQENLNAVRVVKSFVREEREEQKFQSRSNKLRDTAERAFGFVVMFMPIMIMIMGGTTVALMWLGGHDVAEGTLLSGDLMAFFTYSSEILMSLMMVSMVLQKNTLFSGTIRENLRWGREDATDQEIEEACRMACADEFIQRMPDGYDTYIEQGGTNVSGGQKQRLCIARAILRQPKVLILDDSTSAVDTATDAKIRGALKTALPGATKLIIAQRITSVMDADMILVLDDGRVVGQGTHEQLMDSCEIYREVYESQQEGVSIDG